MGTDQRLAALRANVDAFSGRVTAAQGRWMRCAPGCAECCEADFGIFPLEAEAVEDAARRLPDAIASQVADRLRRGLHCAFLVDRRCAVYDQRPIICRTQGLPLKLDDGSRTACPLNFSAEGVLESVPASQVLALDVLNTVLGTIDLAVERERTGCDASGGKSASRVPLAAVARRALGTRDE
jgi:hypothetical protein